jgi:hypothetical protein
VKEKEPKKKKVPVTESSETPVFNAAPKEAKSAPNLGLSLAHAELLMRMMKEYQIDEVNFGGIITLKKSQHQLPMPEEIIDISKRTGDVPSDDQVMFYSAK